jgi:hypothetical protein
MYSVEDVRGFLKDPEAAGFNPQVVKDLLQHYDDFSSNSTRRLEMMWQERDSLRTLVDRLRTYIRDLEFQRDSYEKAAKSWMNDHDKLKEKYEPLVAQCQAEDASIRAAMKSEMRSGAV